MRSVAMVAGLVILGLIVTLFYRDFETRSIAEKALALSDKAQLQGATTKAAVSSLAANVEGRILPVHRTRVTLYVQNSGFTDKDAAKLAAALRPHGFDVRAMRAPAAGKPDAVFIGAYVAAEEAQLLLSSLPYDVDYLLRLDFPRSLGGDPAGRSMLAGYASAAAAKSDDPRARPVRISRQELASLLQPKLTNTEFQLRLRKLAGG